MRLVQELRGKEVTVIVRPKRYAFRSNAEHNRGKSVTGTTLQLVSGPEIEE
jgi:hypothetical protein